MFKIIWALALAFFAGTAGTGVIAFRHSPDHSPLALVQWAIIALALVAPLFLLPDLLSPNMASDDNARRTRAIRVLVLLYLPLSSALSLMAFSQR